jgi:hypothetical protein
MRPIRRRVIFRKTSIGTRSESGLKNHSVLTRLVQTARRQGGKPSSPQIRPMSGPRFTKIPDDDLFTPSLKGTKLLPVWRI